MAGSWSYDHGGHRLKDLAFFALFRCKKHISLFIGALMMAGANGMNGMRERGAFSLMTMVIVIVIIRGVAIIVMMSRRTVMVCEP